MATDDLGDRMKLYEMAEAGRMLMPYLPVLVRLDGRAFHTVTRNLERPYDKGFHDLMVDVTMELVDASGALLGYTQSDEISLVLFQKEIDSQLFFGGRISKLCSILAAQASVTFNAGTVIRNVRIDVAQIPIFDARVWNVPNKTEATNAILWREQDATKNSIQSAARAVYSHKQCENKNGSELQEMLFQKGINWNDYPDFFKRGSYVQRRRFSRPYTLAELELLPEKHAARANPDLVVDRAEIRRLDMPQLSKVTNREEVIFEGADPQWTAGTSS